MGAAVITAIGPTLKATVAQAAAASGAPIAGAGFGQGQIAALMNRCAGRIPSARRSRSSS
jgi:hypothetical protein